MLRTLLVVSLNTLLLVPALAEHATAQKDAVKPPSTREAINVLIIDGQNNHDFVATTQSLRATLIAAERFRVDASMSPSKQAARSTCFFGMTERVRFPERLWHSSKRKG